MISRRIKKFFFQVFFLFVVPGPTLPGGVTFPVKKVEYP